MYGLCRISITEAIHDEATHDTARLGDDDKLALLVNMQDQNLLIRDRRLVTMYSVATISAQGLARPSSMYPL